MWSEKATLGVRRTKAVRRLWKKQPLFAYTIASKLYQDYTPEEFLKDVQPGRRKTKKVKSNQAKYGRYPEVIRLLREYRETGDVLPAIQAQRLMELLRKPFRLQMTWNKERWEFQYSPTTSLATMKKLAVAANESTTFQEFKEKEQALLKYAGMGQ